MLEEDVRDLMERLYKVAVDFVDPTLIQDEPFVHELLDEVEDYLGIEHGNRE